MVHELIYHVHHILPKHMGGKDEPSNLIRLSVLEHAEAHKKLWEQHNKIEDYCAWQGLLGNLNGHQIMLNIMKSDSMRKHLSDKQKQNWSKLDEDTKRKRINQFNESKIGNKNTLGKTWNLSEQSKKNVSDAKSQYWIIISPDGSTQKIKNMLDFCRKNKLDQGAMSNVAKGLKNHHKGYVCKKESVTN